MTHQIGSPLSFDGESRREEELIFFLRLCKLCGVLIYIFRGLVLLGSEVSFQN